MREGSGVSADPHAFQVVLYSYSKVIMQGGSRGGGSRELPPMKDGPTGISVAQSNQERTSEARGSQYKRGESH